MTSSSAFEPRLSRRRRLGRIFAAMCGVVSFVALGVLVVLLVRVVDEGWSWLAPHFLSNFPSVLWPEKAGVKSAIWGTLWLISLTALISVPVGVAAR